jgi:hypothetical protein
MTRVAAAASGSIDGTNIHIQACERFGFRVANGLSTA